jgi:E3 ubiquitin-protein ligase NEDD4
MMRLWPEDLRKRLTVNSEGEDALNYGRVSHEWLFLLSHDPSYGLFDYTLQINPASGMKVEHLDYFNFIGRVFGLVVFHHQFLVPGFYKVVLNKRVNCSCQF